jgi:hypothetical protein
MLSETKRLAEAKKDTQQKILKVIDRSLFLLLEILLMMPSPFVLLTPSIDTFFIAFLSYLPNTTAAIHSPPSGPTL